MDPLTLLLLTAILPTLFGGLTTALQQNREFEQTKELQEDQQDFSASREDLAYLRSLPSTQLQNYLDAGFNGNLAAQSVLGGQAHDVSPISSGSSPAVNSALGALSNMFAQGGSSVADILKKDAEIKNITANTDKTNTENGLLTRDYYLRKMATEAQIRVWNESVDEIKSRVHLNEEETNLVRNQNLYYGREAEAKIEVYQAQKDKLIGDARLVYEQAITEQHKQVNLDSSTAVNQATYQNINMDTAIKGEEYQQKIFETDFIGKYNIPMTADLQQKLTAYLNAGEFDKVNTILDAVFQTALGQHVGQQVSLGFTPRKKTFKTRFGSFEKYDNNEAWFSNPVHSYHYQPIWNPTR